MSWMEQYFVVTNIYFIDPFETALQNLDIKQNMNACGLDETELQKKYEENSKMVYVSS